MTKKAANRAATEKTTNKKTANAAKKIVKPDSAPPRPARRLDARPDTLDFRDMMYSPTLVDVPASRSLDAYQKKRIPILNQGQEGACTGFGLATVVHYLLRQRLPSADVARISPFMLYDMARRYDEWPGEAYEGSSCRGAMKGWQKHGVCELDLWSKSGGIPLSEQRANSAARRPLGAYYRVNHRDLVAMHAAMTETGILYVSCGVHDGWYHVGRTGQITLRHGNTGGHAFALVAYDEKGFWLQNSWGPAWGHQGFAHISYEDWLTNGTDCWVARLAVPVLLPDRASTSRQVFAGAVRSQAYSYADLRPHVISIGNDGLLQQHGNIGTTPALVREIVHNDIPRITQGWKKKRIVLYAHGGLVAEDSALQRVSDYRQPMLDAECYPLAFIWHSDAWSTIKDILDDAADQRRPEGFLDSSKDFMLDRLDDVLEPIARRLGGLKLWSEMKANAMAATVDPNGGARLVLDELALLAASDASYEFHIVGHSAGSIFHAPIVQYLTSRGVIPAGPMQGVHGKGLRVASATLWAPAMTVKLFKATFGTVLASIARFAVFTLDDQTEQDDDCASIYHKSLLYLVSNAFEDTFRIPLARPDGEPILGMQKFIRKDPVLQALFDGGAAAQWVIAPNTNPQGSPGASGAKHHGDFDDDKSTVLATLARVLNQQSGSAAASMQFMASGQRRRAIRRNIDGMHDFALTR